MPGGYGSGTVVTMTTTPTRLRTAAALAVGAMLLAPLPALAARTSSSSFWSSATEQCRQGAGPESAVGGIDSIDTSYAPITCETSVVAANGHVVASAAATSGDDGTALSSGRAIAFGDLSSWYKQKTAAKKLTFVFHFDVASASASASDPSGLPSYNFGGAQLDAFALPSQCDTCTTTASEVLVDSYHGPTVARTGRIDVTVEVTNGTKLVPKGDYSLLGRVLAFAQIGADVPPSAGTAQAAVDATLLGIEVSVQP